MPPEPRPEFTRGFPQEPEIEALVESFARGDYARVRRDAPTIIGNARDERVREAALELLRRTRPAPVAVALLALASGLVLLLSTWWIVHGAPPPPLPPHVEYVR